MVIAAQTRRRLCLVVLILVALVLSGCPRDGDDSSSTETSESSDLTVGEAAPQPADSPTQDDGTVCGLDVAASPAALSGGDPCTSGELIFAETFVREKGKPVAKARTVNVPVGSEVCVTVENGGFASDDARRVSAGWISVDGELVAGPDHFSQEFHRYQDTFEVPAGDHELEVELASGPSAKLGIEVRAAAPGADNEVTMGENDILEVTNVAVDHPMFSPNDDGYHDTALFNADNLPSEKPGEETGDYEYFLEWSWTIIDADTCETVDTLLTGTTQVHSPANVQALWDGSTATGSLIDVYQYNVKYVRSDGLVIDTATAQAKGVLVEKTPPDYDSPNFGDTCDPADDPDGCRCPADTEPGTRCTFAWIPYVEDFQDPSAVDTSQFMTTTFDQATGRWEVVVDLTEYNGGGLVPQSDGVWASAQQLQDYVSELTGVPADTNQLRLFNFDFVQLGYSTPVVEGQGAVDGFNHFLLDLITDAQGHITVAGNTIDVQAVLADESFENLPHDYWYFANRDGDECVHNGNTDGRNSVQAKSCSNVLAANLDPDNSDLGIYVLEKRMYDLHVNGLSTARDTHCIINGIYKCGVRSFQRDFNMRSTSDQFSHFDGVYLERHDKQAASGVPALVTHVDRGPLTFDFAGRSDVLDGICSDDLAARDGMNIPLTSADGSVPSSCIINGIY